MRSPAACDARRCALAAAAMSSDIIARVDSLYMKAEELCDKGHVLRAAENFGRAAAAAQALGEDNLVTLFMQLRRSNMLGIFTTAEAATSEARAVHAAYRVECIALISGAMEVLERRRAVSTLLEGKCAAQEEAWRAGQIHRHNAHVLASTASRWAALFGYEQFVHVAIHAVNVLSCARLFAAECSEAQLQTFAQHVVHAAELMQQPRRHCGVAMDVEAEFADTLRDAVAEAGADGLDARLVRLLAAAWERLQRSGVLQTRHIEHNITVRAREHTAFESTLTKSLNAPGLRSCALPGCGAREAHPMHFKSCAACRMVVYCCREHQVAGWPGHKKACKAARKAAAAEDEAGPSGA